MVWHVIGNVEECLDFSFISFILIYFFISVDSADDGIQWDEYKEAAV